LTAIFDQLKGPVVLDDLVGLVAELRGIKDNVEYQTNEQSTNVSLNHGTVF
jgi:hypothetical protein